MDEIKIVWAKTALKQRNSIFEYWNSKNGNNQHSKKLNKAIRERLKILKAQPLIGRNTIIMSVRTISLRHYSIFYTQKDNSIHIISFWDNRQNPENLLKILKS